MLRSLKEIRARAISLNGEGYWTRAGTPTEAAEDVRQLLKRIDNGTKNPKRRAHTLRRNARR